MKKFQLLLISLVSLIISLSAADAQYLLEITILDADNKEPVPYATIMFPAQGTGFSANGSGQFKLPVEAIERQRILIISSIGYDPFKSQLGAMVDQKLDTIFLKPKITVLKEVLVKAANETPMDMISNTSKKMNKFFSEDPYYINTFYKESVKRDGRFVGYAEAYGILHVSGYQPRFNRKNELFAYDLAQWKDLRRTFYIVPSECDRDKKRALSIEKLLKAKGEYLYDGPLSKINLDKFTYMIDSATNYQGTDVFVISFQPKDEQSYSGTAYIKVDDDALLGIEVTNDNINYLFEEGCDIKTMNSVFKASFTKINEHYYLKSASLNITYNWNNSILTEELVIIADKFNADKVEELNYDQRMIIFNEMINPETVYNPDFWESKGEPVDEVIITDMGQNMSIEDQFFRNSGKRPIPLPDNFGNYEQLYKNQDIFRLFINNEF